MFTALSGVTLYWLPFTRDVVADKLDFSTELRAAEVALSSATTVILTDVGARSAGAVVGTGSDAIPSSKATASGVLPPIAARPMNTLSTLLEDADAMLASKSQ